MNVVVRNTKYFIIISIICLSQISCSVKQLAIKSLADTLASGGSVFASDDDPELIAAAVPFSLKLIEALLEESPNNEDLLLSAARGFTQYNYGFVHLKAKRMAFTSSGDTTILNIRAKKLYLRAKNYGLHGLELQEPGFLAKLRANPQAAVADLDKFSVPFLYWTAAAWGGAMSTDKNDFNLLGEIPLMEALMYRALELDPGYEAGSIHNFLITYEMSRSNSVGNPADLARKHFNHAVALTDGLLASPYVSLAEAVSIQEQNLEEFRNSLKKAMAIDPDLRPEWRLENKLMQEHANWLLSMTDEFFLLPLDVEDSDY